MDLQEGVEHELQDNGGDVVLDFLAELTQADLGRRGRTADLLDRVATCIEYLGGNEFESHDEIQRKCSELQEYQRSLID